jgi:carboxyl-terminal processing protease
VFLLVAFVAGLGGGILLDRQVLAQDRSWVSVPSSAHDEFRLIAEAYRTIDGDYVNQEAVKPRRMAYGAVDGMVQTLGDAGHTRFLTPEMVERHRDLIQGQYEGIGARVEMRDGEVTVVAPFDDSPAQEAGLQAGDAIIGVNGDDISGLSLEQATQRIMGPVGTTVTLTVRDAETGKTRTVTIGRAEVELEIVTWARLPGTSVAHLRIASFSEEVSSDLGAALNQMQGEGIEALILDLRNNPGGLLNQAVEVASYFLESGSVLRIKDAGGEITEVPVEDDIQATTLPIVVLVNEGTASGAEVVTGALQDGDRAIVIGMTTFGTGTVLQEFELADGSVLLLAVEEWRTPQGRVIWHKGLEPDIKVTPQEDAGMLVPLEEQDLTPQELRRSGDSQLLRALDVLADRHPAIDAEP